MEPKKKKILLKLLIPWLLFFAAVGVIIFLIYRNPSTSQKVPGDNVAQVIEAVSKLVILPQGETPIFARVTNLDQIKHLPFFANAKIGDEVLIYAQSKKAVLYDPIANKIVEIADSFINSGDLNSTSSSD